MNIEQLRTMGRVKKFDKGDFICLEQEQGNTAYLLLQGRTEVVLRSFQDNTYKMTELRPGTVFGEMSLLEDKPRNASVRATEDDTLVLEMEKDNFFEILQADSEIAWNLMNMLLTRLERMMWNANCNNILRASGYKKNVMYSRIKRLTKEQFAQILQQDTNYAYQLLRFLSGALAEMNDEVLKEAP